MFPSIKPAGEPGKGAPAGSGMGLLAYRLQRAQENAAASENAPSVGTRLTSRATNDGLDSATKEAAHPGAVDAEVLKEVQRKYANLPPEKQFALAGTLTRLARNKQAAQTEEPSKEDSSQQEGRVDAQVLKKVQGKYPKLSEQEQQALAATLTRLADREHTQGQDAKAAGTTEPSQKLTDEEWQKVAEIQERLRKRREQKELLGNGTVARFQPAASGVSSDTLHNQFLAALAGNPQFCGFTAAVKRAVLTEVGRHTTDEVARRTLGDAVTSPGFGFLADEDKNRLVQLCGGTRSLCHANRQALRTLLDEAAFRLASPAEQARQLRTFLTNQPGAPPTVTMPGDINPPRVPYRLLGPTFVANHIFRSGVANADRYDVEVGGRRIPVWIPHPLPPECHGPEEVAQALAQLPPVGLATVAQVTVNPGRNPEDSYWESVYGMSGFCSYMTAGAAGFIDIFPVGVKQSKWEMNGSLIHETGHILSKRAWGDDPNGPRWEAWRNASARDGVFASQYARVSAEEDFSETLHVYQRVCGTPAEAEYRRLMPERFRILDGMVGG